ncbi:hypothetical protein HWV62_26368 [Athelia sp. TMB]|nr:hypothetical protein HWV62_26368 [Athelia sp. TMB]
MDTMNNDDRDRSRRHSMRGASHKAAAAMAEQLADSPPSSPTKTNLDADPFGDPVSNRKEKVKVQYGGKKGPKGNGAGVLRSVKSTISATSNAPNTPVNRNIGNNRKRAFSDADGFSSSDESLLTPLPPSVQSSKSVTKRKAPLRDTPSPPGPSFAAAPNRNRLQHTQSTPAIPNKAYTSQTPHANSSPAKAPSLEHTNGTMRTGAYVWLLIGVESKAIGDEKELRMWWPGYVSLSNPLQVTLSHGSGASGPIDIPNPSPDILRDGKCASFCASTFLVLPSDTDLGTSPRKKQKIETELQKNWQAAVDAMKELEDDLNEEPDFEEALASIGPAKPRQHEDSIVISDTEHMDIDPIDLEPPISDGLLTIPGHLVLCKDKATSTEYWPARIEMYHPPNKPSGKGRYQIKFLDKKIRKVPREWFYDESQDEFGTCTIGTFHSENPEVEADSEHEEKLERGISPIPLDPPPIVTDFEKLTIREELAYVKPILSAILADEYPPAREKHIGYCKGGKAREAVVAGAAERGSMSVRDLDALHGYIRRWVLREAIVERGQIEEEEKAGPSVEGVSEEISSLIPSASLPETGSSSPPEAPPSSYAATVTDDLDGGSTSARDDPQPLDAPAPDLDDLRAAPQTGCEAYENLLYLDKLGYCQNVLLPEAVRQILLWRKGVRRSVHLLSDDEEQQLCIAGEKLRNATDWVRDIMRLRESLTRRAQKKAKKHAPPAPGPISGTRSRPQRGAVNYRS